MTIRESITKARFRIDTGIDLDNRTIEIADEIDDEMLYSVRVGLSLLPGEVTININSPGGDIFAGMAIIDAIKAHNAPVNIHVMGTAASMACIILQAGTRRLASPNAVIMHHVGSMGITSDHFTNVKKLVGFTDKYSERLNKIMLDRINEKRAKDFAAGDLESKPRSMAWFKERDMVDQWMTAEEALDLGLIDEIVPN